jgi:hypothetical protein
MKAIVVTDQAAGTAGMKLAERPVKAKATIGIGQGRPSGRLPRWRRGAHLTTDERAVTSDGFCRDTIRAGT